MINLLLQDGVALKSFHMSVLIEHRPMVIKNFDVQGRAPLDLTVLQKHIGDRQHYPDVYTNLVESLYNGLEYVQQTEPKVHSTIFERIRVHQVDS